MEQATQLDALHVLSTGKYLLLQMRTAYNEFLQRRRDPEPPDRRTIDLQGLQLQQDCLGQEAPQGAVFVYSLSAT